MLLTTILLGILSTWTIPKFIYNISATVKKCARFKFRLCAIIFNYQLAQNTCGLHHRLIVLLPQRRIVHLHCVCWCTPADNVCLVHRCIVSVQYVRWLTPAGYCDRMSYNTRWLMPWWSCAYWVAEIKNARQPCSVAPTPRSHWKLFRVSLYVTQI